MTTRPVNGARLRQRLTVDELVQQLRLMILDGDLPAGTRLRQQHLARQFGVAVTMVREALRDLKGQGWVESVHYQGTFVAKYDGRKLFQLLEVREVLEGLSARLCCQRLNREQLRELRSLVEQNYDLMARQDPESFREAFRVDRAFHDRLGQIAGNPSLAVIAESCRVMGPPIAFTQAKAESTRNEHLAILEAIEADRADDAERLMREHIRGCRDRFMQEITSASSTFPNERQFQPARRDGSPPVVIGPVI